MGSKPAPHIASVTRRLAGHAGQNITARSQHPLLWCYRAVLGERGEPVSGGDRLTLKVIMALLAALVLGMLIETWLVIKPPRHDPPHPSYLP